MFDFSDPCVDAFICLIAFVVFVKSEADKLSVNYGSGFVESISICGYFTDNFGSCHFCGIKEFSHSIAES